MGAINGFQQYNRQIEDQIDPKNRIENYREFTIPMTNSETQKQGSRCMDCGVPFCHSGCPLGNLIPDFNHMVHQKEWQKAAWILQSTNNFPEFTGRLCPAPCEQACVLGIHSDPVAIETIEKNIIEKAFEMGWIKAQKPSSRTGKEIAIIGSGPAGLAAAQQLNRAGHLVTIFEKADRPGGLLRYGIPNFKLEKTIIDRRIKLLEEEGIQFQLNTEVGKDISLEELKSKDAVLICTGAEKPRSLDNLKEAPSVYQAMEYLTHQTKSITLDNYTNPINAQGKRVIVIGGGDTGSDCIGTANRQGAISVVNFEILPKPPKQRSATTPWPFWPLKLKTSSSHEEGCERDWLIQTKEAVLDENQELKAIKTVQVEWHQIDGKYELKEVPDSEKTWPCDLVFLALGFTGPTPIKGLELDQRGFYQTKDAANVFVAGDARRGQSLIVWAIAEGREVAKKIDHYLETKSYLSSKGHGDLMRA